MRSGLGYRIVSGFEDLATASSNGLLDVVEER